ncbi:MAG: tRNA dihydrouridine synthase DusB [Gammaproteobacteria bacterium]
MKIGNIQLKNNLILAPLSGITDLPFRKLCLRFGAGMTVAEMVDCNACVRDLRNTKLRLRFCEEEIPRCVQLVGNRINVMAEAAKFCEDEGAQIIDINMGCPVKKVCGKNAGAALMQDEKLAAELLSKIVSAVKIPVTAKMRLGWDNDHQNVLQIARIAEDAGVCAITIHGRTRADKYNVPARYDLIKLVKQKLKIPVIANGDINSRAKMLEVLEFTQADGVMIGRAALGRPWIFKELLDEDVEVDLCALITEHLQMLYDFYGERIGVTLARKHVGWYLKGYPHAKKVRQEFYALTSKEQQLEYISATFRNARFITDK